jgi:hypothetical protein
MQRRMRCISLRSVCPRGPLRPLLSRAPWNPPCACCERSTRPLLLWLARWTRPLLRAHQVKGRDAGCAVHEPAICGHVSLFRRPLDFSTLFGVRFPSTGPLVASQDPLWLSLLTRLGVGVLTDNERCSFLLPAPCLCLSRGRRDPGGRCC